MARYRVVRDREGRVVTLASEMVSFGSPDAEKSLDIRLQTLTATQAEALRRLSLESGGDGLTKDAVMVLEDQLKDPEFREAYIKAAVTGKLDATAEELTRV